MNNVTCKRLRVGRESGIGPLYKIVMFPVTWVNHSHSILSKRGINLKKKKGPHRENSPFKWISIFITTVEKMHFLRTKKIP